MTERNEEYFKQFIGYEFGPDKYRVKGKNLSAYSAAIGDKNPKFYVEKPEGDEKPDYSHIVAHPAYAATYTIPGLLMQLAEVKDKEGNKLVKNIGKLLHTSQEYNYDGCDPLTPADRKVFTVGKIVNLFIKNEKLWVELLFTSTNADKTKTFCRTTIKGLLRKGGF
ncbi:FAS1-like dehydratase domain-containing protein [Candidatus Harpocratesius sp.]